MTWYHLKEIKTLIYRMTKEIYQKSRRKSTSPTKLPKKNHRKFILSMHTIIMSITQAITHTNYPSFERANPFSLSQRAQLVDSAVLGKNTIKQFFDQKTLQKIVQADFVKLIKLCTQTNLYTISLS